jgi:hypothetical protein
VVRRPPLLTASAIKEIPLFLTVSPGYVESTM